MAGANVRRWGPVSPEPRPTREGQVSTLGCSPLERVLDRTRRPRVRSTHDKTDVLQVETRFMAGRAWRTFSTGSEARYRNRRRGRGSPSGPAAAPGQLRGFSMIDQLR